jgi:hypothetical protein
VSRRDGLCIRVTSARAGVAGAILHAKRRSAFQLFRKPAPLNFPPREPLVPAGGVA